ncbi:HIT family protein [Emcibacteraceae bacterium]|nr:HIT family protein [Emcibacteraceae bacterium]
MVGNLNERNQAPLSNTTCIFCNIEQDRIISEDQSFIVIRDVFPVTFLHTLIIPKRHIETYFDLSAKEIMGLNKILLDEKVHLESEDTSITGFNIGMNCGQDAGQTVMHCHIHLIPRRKGDMDDPRGGVRGVIPDKQKY